MFSSKNSDRLLAQIRDGRPMTGTEKLNLIIGLSIPSMLAQVTSVLMFFIDASMVGSLGTQASAAIGLVESSSWLFGSITMATSMGFSVQVAHFIGANNFVKAREVFRHGIVCSLLLSLVVALIGVLIHHSLPFWLGGGADIAHDASLYFLIVALTIPFLQIGNLSSSMLKSTGNMRIPSVVSVLMCVLDVVFNFLLIFPTREISVLDLSFTMPGANLGVVGAALGTSFSYILTALLLAWFAMCQSKILALRLDKERFRWVWDYVRNAFKIGTPMALQSMLMSGAQIVSTIIVAPLGNYAIAANTFAITAESLCYMPGYGIGDAATTLVGQSCGAGRYDLCRSFACMTVFLGMAVMAVMGFIMYIFAPEMIGVLTPVEEIRTLGVQSLRIEAFAEPFFAASIVAYSVCVGAGDTLKPALINLGSMWLVRLTMAAALAPRYGLKGVWIAMAAELTFRGCLFLYRLFRGNWLKMQVT